MNLAGLHHAEPLSKLHGRCFASGWGSDYFAQLLSNPTILCGFCETGGSIAGLIVTQTVVGESEILTLGIDPDHRRKSLGRRMLTWMCALLADQGSEAVFLEVSELNEAAIGLYQSEGFRVMGRRRHYYSTPNGPADALTMRRDLNT
jgi:ribosomal-protein-alanine N-acetyltransferase